PRIVLPRLALIGLALIGLALVGLAPVRVALVAVAGIGVAVGEPPVVVALVRIAQLRPARIRRLSVAGSLRCVVSLVLGPSPVGRDRAAVGPALLAAISLVRGILRALRRPAGTSR